MIDSVLVSIIVPIYNVEAYLKECIESILRQTYSHYELILVDDGSTDKSSDICDRYAKQDSRIVVIRKINGGASSARNKGVETAQGKYIYMLDSDDYIENCTIEELVKHAVENESDLVFFDAHCIELNSDIANTEQRYLRNNRYESKNGKEVVYQLMVNKEYHVNISMLFIKRELLNENQLQMVEGIIYEDMLFTYQVFCFAKNVSYINKAYYTRRYRENSVMTAKKTIKNFMSANRLYQEVRNFTFDYLQQDLERFTPYIIRIASNAISDYRILDKESQKKANDVYKVMIQDIIEQQSYGSKALEMKCKSDIHWYVYKIYEKLFRRK